jgi:hypothetical protein
MTVAGVGNILIYYTHMAFRFALQYRNVPPRQRLFGNSRSPFCGQMGPIAPPSGAFWSDLPAAGRTKALGQAVPRGLEEKGARQADPLTITPAAILTARVPYETSWLVWVTRRIVIPVR